MKRLLPAFLYFCLSSAASAHDAAHLQDPVLRDSESQGIDLTRLPLGDGHISTAPMTGWIWACRVDPDAGGAFRDGPWIRSDGTYDFAHKLAVQGEVTWKADFKMTLDGGKRRFVSNDLPDHPTGRFPISPDDPAFQYDRNPNSIREQKVEVALPAVPEPAAHASCAPGAVGILNTGAVLFSALDAPGRDAVAHETQDTCQGHPQQAGAYHYHSLTTCIKDEKGPDGHSKILGYALDGFGIFGHYGEGGKILSSADLDECHGHAHAIEWNGKKVVMYHYHATWDFPYTVGCMRGRVRMADVMAVSAGPRGCRHPDLGLAAEKLGISEQRLHDALGPPPPDLAAAAAKLGIPVEDLHKALEESRPLP